MQQPLYLIGIGGTGMTPLAEIAQSFGYEVIGSDSQPSASVTRLQGHGIKVFLEQHEKNLPEQATVVVSSAINEDNPELMTARQRGLKILHRSELLATLMQERTAVTVSGTHGKTTTSSLIAYLLDQLNLKPTAAIGGELIGYKRSLANCNSPYFVAEADESDGSFLRYRPFISVLTNVDSDHLDHFGNLDQLQQACRDYLNTTDVEGCSVVGWDSKPIREISEGLKHRRLSYGFSIGSEVRAFNIKVVDGYTSFDVVVEHDLMTCRLALFGRHNVANALGGLAVIRALDGDVSKAADALATFPGVRRRMELKGQNETTSIYDDYAHNPGKIRAATSGLKEAFADRRLLAIFQPHRYSRLKTTYDLTTQSFCRADHVIVLPVYAAGEKSLDGFTAKRIARDISEHSAVSAISVDNMEDALCEAQNFCQKQPTNIVTLGAGDVSKLADQLTRSLCGKES